MQKLGRKLNTKEEVHHRDGNKLNNNPVNLMLIDITQYNISVEKKARSEEQQQRVREFLDKNPNYKPPEKKGYRFLEGYSEPK